MPGVLTAPGISFSIMATDPKALVQAPGPKSATVDGNTTTAHDLMQVMAFDKYCQSKTVGVKNAFHAIGKAKVCSPGAVSQKRCGC